MGVCSATVSRCFCLASLCIALCACSEEGPDLIFFGGPVLTVDSQEMV